MQTHSLRTISQNRYYIPKSVYHCQYQTYSTDCKHVRMVFIFIRAVETSTMGARRNYTIFNPRHIKPPTFRPPATAYLFQPRCFSSGATDAFYHLIPRATVIA